MKTRNPCKPASDMTPTIFCVRPNASAREVVEMMVGRGVRQLFVVDHADVLVGVISPLDMLRHLCLRKRRAA